MSQVGRKLISQKLKEIRTSAGVTMEQLSLAIGYDNSYISKVEKEKVNIGIDTIEAISDFFNIPVKDFLNKL